uniref:Major capsid protein double jelly-roll n=1 Tax=Clandestinovirus TaxID=2831644 RepID=A0A8F8KQP2_9VIRU|nr:major capsid protein double jelly-roll [Clandestinovirus]
MDLTVRPAKTFFKAPYKRYSNFAVGQIEQQFQGGVAFGKKMTAIIQRNGDLLAEMYVVLRLSAITATNEAVATPNPAIELGYPRGPIINPDTTPPTGVHFTNAVGHAAIDRVSVSIGGHEFDVHYGDYLHIWEQLASKPGKELGSLIGDARDVDTLLDYAADEQILYVPLQFWFNRTWAQALPMIALQYHEVRLDLTLKSREQLIQVSSPASTNYDIQFEGGDLEDAFLLCNYIFLDTWERRLFAQKYHTYLFDQLQFTGAESKADTKNSLNMQLRFNHPVQELIWVCQENDAINQNQWFDYSIQIEDPTGPDAALTGVAGPTISVDPLVQAKLQFNGHDRISFREAIYFRQVQPLEHHTKIPEKFIYIYSFAKDPEDAINPSGSCNMSRIDNVVLNLVFNPSFSDGEVRCYARSKNIMRIISGMAGVSDEIAAVCAPCA